MQRCHPSQLHSLLSHPAIVFHITCCQCSEQQCVALESTLTHKAVPRTHIPAHRKCSNTTQSRGNTVISKDEQGGEVERHSPLETKQYSQSYGWRCMVCMSREREHTDQIVSGYSSHQYGMGLWSALVALESVQWSCCCSAGMANICFSASRRGLVPLNSCPCRANIGMWVGSRQRLGDAWRALIVFTNCIARTAWTRVMPISCCLTQHHSQSRSDTCFMFIVNSFAYSDMR
jgi:hypothetical protein